MVPNTPGDRQEQEPQASRGSSETDTATWSQEEAQLCHIPQKGPGWQRSGQWRVSAASWEIGCPDGGKVCGRAADTDAPTTWGAAAGGGALWNGG